MYTSVLEHLVPDVWAEYLAWQTAAGDMHNKSLLLSSPVEQVIAGDFEIVLAPAADHVNTTTRTRHDNDLYAIFSW